MITVSNDAAGATAFNASLTDVVPPSLQINQITTTTGTCTKANNNVSCAFGNLAAGASVSVTINVTTFQALTLSNTVTVGAANPDPNTANNSDTEMTLVQGADLTIDKTDSVDPATSGANFDYNLLVSNIGAIDAANVFVSDNLPSGVQFVSATAGCTESSGFVQCDLGTLAPKNSVNIVITVKPLTVGNLSNTASVQTSTAETDYNNNSDTETTAVLGADLALTQTSTPATVNIGSVVTYNFAVTNNGPAIADSVRISDALPNNVALISSSDGCAPNANGVLTLSLGKLNVGQTKNAVVTVVALAGDTAINPATVSTATGDPNSANDSATATTILTVGGNASNYAFSTATDGSFISTFGGRNIFVGDEAQGFFFNPTFDLGFEFHLMGRRFTRFAVSPDGYVQLGEGGTLPAPPLGVSNESGVIIAPFGSNQNLNPNSLVRTIVTGIAPNRIRVVTWSNLSSNASGTTSDLTYQLQLFEATGAIKFVYGKMQMSANAAANSASNQVHIGFSADDQAGKIGSISAAQNSTGISYNSSSPTPAINIYNSAGAIQSLDSNADGARRVIVFTPTNAPNAPGNLTFSNVSQTAMTLNWSDNSANENGFAIYRSIDGVNFGFNAQTTADQTSFTADELDPNTNYFWRVAAIGEGTIGATVSGSQSTIAANSVAANAAGGNWSNPATWSGGVLPTAADNVSIPAGASIIIDTDVKILDLNVGGTLEFELATARFIQTKNVLIAAGGALQVSASGSQFNHEICVGGNLTNNGTLDLHADPACCNRPAARLAFKGSGDAVLGGTGATTDVSTIRIFKPNFDALTVAAHTLEIAPTNFTVRGTSGGDAFGFADIRTGILKISGSFPLETTLLTPDHLSGSVNSTVYTLDTNQSVWLDNPNFSWLSSANNHDFNGTLRVTNASGNSFLRKAAITNLTFENGAMQMQKATITNFTQTGGTLTIFGGGSFDGGIPPFNIPANGSSFTQSGGSIVFQTPQTDLFPEPTPTDYLNFAAQQNLIGGTIQFGNTSSGSAKIFTMCGNVFNLVINNQSAGHTVVSLCGVRVLGDTTLNPNTTLSVGGNDETFSAEGANFINNGKLTVIPNSANISAFLFGGTVAQTYSGSGTAGTNAAPLGDFDIFNTGGGVTISNVSPTIITRRVNLFTGTFINSGKIQIGAGGASSAIIQRGNASAQITPSGEFDVAPTFNVGSGGLAIFYGIAGASLTTGNEIPPSRLIRQLLVDGSNSVILNGGNLTLDGSSGTRSLALVNGIFETGANRLIVKSSITVTRTSGWVNGNLQMEYNQTGAKIFHVGTANGYSPVTANVTTLGTNPSSLTVKAIQTNHPNAPNQASALKRYWQLTESGDLTARLTFQYLDADLPAVTESSLQLKRYTGAGTIFDTIPATLDTTANTAATTSGISDFSDWTLLSPLSPTAVAVSMGGRVKYANGKGIFRAQVSLTDSSGATRTTLTNQFGKYQFDDVPAGETYIISVSHRLLQLGQNTQVRFVGEDDFGIDFVVE